MTNWNAFHASTRPPPCLLDSDHESTEHRGKRRLSGTPGDFHAADIFPKFGGHAETRGGSQLVLSSGDVRAILRETTDRSEWPNETIKRAMTWTANLTSRRDEKREWDACDDENLLTLRHGRSGELVVDIGEYREYYAELEEDQEQTPSR
ncbi:uncharacterized protein HHUB_3505 [Halobacterium hubeiense]|uniref:Uncharacterized protein n=1 Tax=Halobacterium hubeiense TaxID=1407499 RepID=A0A0U5H578_9EURY|nr:uncharacterized protein HHUB_3505 [Halobacterium hubeiense]